MSKTCQKHGRLRLNEFLSQRAVFTVGELDRFLSKRGSSNPNTRKSLLAYYRKRERIISLRRGLYATVPPGSDPRSTPVDPYLVAAKMSADAVLAYHTALEFHGKAYSDHTLFHYLSAHKSLPLKFRAHEFRRAAVPQALLNKGKEMFGVTVHRRGGVELSVTGLERTFVDVLDRPDLSGSREEIWRSLESIEFFDLDRVVEYVLLLENATTAAKTGFFLDQHRETLMVDDSHRKQLLALRPRQPHYFARSNHKDCQLVGDWNLMVPVEILNRSWGEVL